MAKKKLTEWEDDLDYSPEESFQRLKKPWMQGKNFILVKTLQQIEEFVQQAKQNKILALDFETTGLNLTVYPKIKWDEKQKPILGPDGKIQYILNDKGEITHEPFDKVVGICLATDVNTGYYIPIRHYEDPRYGKTNLPQDDVFRILNQLIDDPSIRIVFHNSKFDLEVYRNSTLHDPTLFRDIKEVDKFEDTLLLAYLWEPDLMKHGLKNLSKLLLKAEMIEIDELFTDNRAKREVQLDQLRGEEAYYYGCSDAMITLMLYYHLVELMKKDQLEQPIIYKIEKQVSQVLRSMQRNKITVDVDYFTRLKRYLAGQIKRITKQICEVAGRKYEEKNPHTYEWISSPKQLGLILFEELNIEGGKKTEKGDQYSTADEDLEKVSKQHPIVSLIQEYRKYCTLKVRYTDPFTEYIDFENKAKVQFQQTVITGRFKCEGGDWLKGNYTGVNWQSIPACNNAIGFKAKKLTKRPFIEGFETEFVHLLTSENAHDRTFAQKKMQELQNVGSIKLEELPKNQKLEKQYTKFFENKKNEKKWAHCVVTKKDLDENYLYRWLEEVYCARESCEGCPLLGKCEYKQEYIDLNKEELNIRKGFIAPEGFVTVAIDFSGVELRVAANVAKEDSWIEQFVKQKEVEIENLKRLAKGEEEVENPWGDLHTLNAKHIFGENYTKEQRGITKCVTGDTLLLTENGLVRLDEVVQHREEGFKEITNGLIIESKIGKKTATQAYYHPKAPIWRVETELGFELKGTFDHEVLVVDNGKTKLVKLGDLKKDDLMVIKAGTNCHGNKVNLPIIDQEALKRTSFKKLDLPKKLEPWFARFLGYLISEGSISQNKDPQKKYIYSIQISMANEAFAKEMEDISKKYFNKRLKCENITLTTELPVRNLYSYQLNSKSLYALLEKLGITNKLSIDKIIPNAILQAPKDLKREFFRALFEGDGIACVDGDISYTSKSEKLVRQIHLEFLNWGIVGYFRKDWNKKYGRYFYTWYCNNKKHVKKFMDEIGFAYPEKHNRILDALKKRDDEEQYKRSNLQIEGFNDTVKEIFKKQDQYCKENNISKFSSHKPLEHISGRNRDAFDIRIKRKMGVGDKWLELIQNRVDGELKEFIDNQLFTVRVRKVEDLNIEQEVFDIFEPETRLMVSNGLVTLDSVLFQSLYGGSGRGVANNLRNEGVKITDEEGEAFQKKFFEKTPHLKKWFQRQHEQAMKTGRVQTPFGRIRKIPECLGKRLNGATGELQDVLDEDRKRLIAFGKRSAVNSPVQGGAADLIKIGMGKINNLIEKNHLENDVRLLLTVHDELVFEIRKTKLNQILPQIVKEMVNVTKKWVAPLKVDAEVGQSWFVDHEFGEGEDEIHFLKITDFENQGIVVEKEKKVVEQPKPIVQETKSVDGQKPVEVSKQEMQKPMETIIQQPSEIKSSVQTVSFKEESKDPTALISAQYEKIGCYVFSVKHPLLRAKAQLIRKAILDCPGEVPLVILTEDGRSLLTKEQNLLIDSERFEFLMRYEGLL